MGRDSRGLRGSGCGLVLWFRRGVGLGGITEPQLHLQARKGELPQAFPPKSLRHPLSSWPESHPHVTALPLSRGRTVLGTLDGPEGRKGVWGVPLPLPRVLLRPRELGAPRGLGG